jgi:hypothetical protein
MWSKSRWFTLFIAVASSGMFAACETAPAGPELSPEVVVAEGAVIAGTGSMYMEAVSPTGKTTRTDLGEYRFASEVGYGIGEPFILERVAPVQLNSDEAPQLDLARFA